MKRTAALLLMMVPLVAFGMNDDKDKSFFKRVAEASKSEIDAGQLAQQKGNSQAVKDFGTMMVKDHSAANDKLETLASAEGVKLPSGEGVKHKAEDKVLQMKSGDSFDRAYIKEQIKAHEQTIALLQKEIASGKDPQAQQFASATLPTVQQHLDKINQIAAAAGVNR